MHHLWFLAEVSLYSLIWLTLLLESKAIQPCWSHPWSERSTTSNKKGFTGVLPHRDPGGFKSSTSNKSFTFINSINKTEIRRGSQTRSISLFYSTLDILFYVIQAPHKWLVLLIHGRSPGSSGINHKSRDPLHWRRYGRCSLKVVFSDLNLNW